MFLLAWTMPQVRLSTAKIWPYRQQAEEHLNEMERVALRDYPPRTMRTDFPITRRTTI